MTAEEEKQSLTRASNLADVLKESLHKAIKAGQEWEHEWYVTNEEVDDGGQKIEVTIFPRPK